MSRTCTYICYIYDSPKHHGRIIRRANYFVKIYMTILL